MMLAVTFTLSLLATLLLTGLVRRYALSRAVLDLPNARSLHVVPVPRGGGLALLPPVFLVALAEVLSRGEGLRVTLIFLGGAGLLALLGWSDDQRPLSAKSRFALQFCILGLCLYALWWASGSPFGLACALWLPAMVWFVNLYNFMDGSDGLAGSQALAGGMGIAMLGTLEGMPGIALTGTALAGASAGFLYWNWSPARIFMGDVGSYFLGGAFALLLLRAGLAGSTPWPWLLLFVPFVTDATCTLLWRMARGERFWQAHREHAYQRLILRGCSHQQVALGCLLLNLLVLPVAALAWHRPAAGPALTLAAYALAVVLWWCVPRHPDAAG